MDVKAKTHCLVKSINNSSPAIVEKPPFVDHFPNQKTIGFPHLSSFTPGCPSLPSLCWWLKYPMLKHVETLQFPFSVGSSAKHQLATIKGIEVEICLCRSHWAAEQLELSPCGCVSKEENWVIAILVGGCATPLKNMSSSVGMMTFPIGKSSNSFSKPPTRCSREMWFVYQGKLAIRWFTHGFGDALCPN